MRTPLRIAILTVVLGLTMACAPPPPGAPPYYPRGGVLMGAATGAVIGHAIDPTGGAVTGALGGALVGGAISNRRMQRYGYYDYGPPPGYYNPPSYYNSY